MASARGEPSAPSGEDQCDSAGLEPFEVRHGGLLPRPGVGLGFCGTQEGGDLGLAFALRERTRPNPIDPAAGKRGLRRILPYGKNGLLGKNLSSGFLGFSTQAAQEHDRPRWGW